MSSCKIIGIIGLAGSGKTIVAKHLAENYGYTRTRFAEPIKKMLKYGIGLTDDEIDGRLKEEPMERFNGMTPRYMMQTLGTEWGRRRLYGNIWVDAWSDFAGKVDGPVAVDDVRFSNEAKAVHDLGGVLWRVHRPGVEIMRHPSEVAMQGIKEDRYIMNSTTISSLLRSVDALMEDL